LSVYRYTDCLVLRSGILHNEGDEDLPSSTLRVRNVNLLTLGKRPPAKWCGDSGAKPPRRRRLCVVYELKYRPLPLTGVIGV